jgi:propionyl-CoA synthetase
MTDLSKYITYGERSNDFTNEIYSQEFKNSIENREDFWKKQAENVSWSKFPTQILDDSHQYLKKWYVDGEINICYNAIDRHVEAGRGDATSFIYDSVYTGEKVRYTYSELQ